MLAKDEREIDATVLIEPAGQKQIQHHAVEKNLFNFSPHNEVTPKTGKSKVVSGL